MPRPAAASAWASTGEVVSTDGRERESGSRGGRVEHLTHPVSAAHHDERFLHELGDGDARAAGERMPRRHLRPQVGMPEHHGTQLGGRDARADGEVGVAALDRAVDVLGHRLDRIADDPLGAGMHDERGDHVGHGGRRGDHREIRHGPARDRAGGGARLGRAREEVLGDGEERPAGGGQRESAGGAIEEGEAEILFESPDLPAQRRLGDVDHGGRTVQGAGLADGEEVAQQAKIH